MCPQKQKQKRNQNNTYYDHEATIKAKTNVQWHLIDDVNLQTAPKNTRIVRIVTVFQSLDQMERF